MLLSQNAQKQICCLRCRPPQFVLPPWAAPARAAAESHISGPEIVFWLFARAGVGRCPAPPFARKLRRGRLLPFRTWYGLAASATYAMADTRANTRINNLRGSVSRSSSALPSALLIWAARLWPQYVWPHVREQAERRDGAAGAAQQRRHGRCKAYSASWSRDSVLLHAKKRR